MQEPSNDLELSRFDGIVNFVIFFRLGLDFAAMSEDKKKMLQAMAAKRKADNEAGGRKKPKEVAVERAVPGRKDVKGLGGGKVQKSSQPISMGKVKAKPTAKKKVETKWDSASDTSEEEDVSGESEEDEDDAGDEDSEDSGAPKKSAKRPAAKPAIKSSSAKKGKAVVPTHSKDSKGKGKMKGKKKADSDDSDAENGAEDDDSDLSEDPLDEVNPDNILPSRTRRRTAQPVSYDFGSGDLDEDDDSDDE